jgi:hydrogenase maturation protease
MQRVLIIAIGNPLRSDDGLAWHAADQLKQTLNFPEIEITKTQQLLPELAESISQASFAIFLDASVQGEPGELQGQILEPEPPQAFTHELTPGGILSLSLALYGNRPQAFVLSLTGKSFEHGECLTPEVANGVPRVVDKVRELVAEYLQQAPPGRICEQHRA